MNITETDNKDKFIFNGGKQIDKKNTKIFSFLALVMSCYFAGLSIAILFTNNKDTLIFTIPCLLAYLIDIFTIKHMSSLLQNWLNYGISLLFITAFVIAFGWSCGVHYFIFVIMAIQFTTGWGSIKNRIWNTFILAGLYLILFLCGRFCFPVYEIEPMAITYFQIFSFIGAFMGLFVCLVVQTESVKTTEDSLFSAEEQLKHYASEDALTGLMNRKTMMQYMEKLVDKENESETVQIAVAIGDVDSFSKINDRYGHDCGDAIIRRLAYILSTGMKDYGKIARWGGEQFLFIFEDASGEDAYYYLTRLQQHIREEDFFWHDERINLTMTYGLMEYNPEKSIDFCIVEADKKMFMGKESGRNTIIY